MVRPHSYSKTHLMEESQNPDPGTHRRRLSAAHSSSAYIWGGKAGRREERRTSTKHTDFSANLCVYAHPHFLSVIDRVHLSRVVQLHTLEDFSAHSNFCELALASLGHDVFLHVGDHVRIQAPNRKMVAPLVTGKLPLILTSSLLQEVMERLDRNIWIK